LSAANVTRQAPLAVTTAAGCDARSRLFGPTHHPPGRQLVRRPFPARRARGAQSRDRGVGFVAPSPEQSEGLGNQGSISRSRLPISKT